MARFRHLVHALIFALTVHVWGMVTSDRMLDAMADVALDKGATIALHLSPLPIKGE